MNARKLKPAAPEELEFPDINEFVFKNGRLPQLGKDPIAPWRYRGWLLYYVQMGDRNKAPEVIDRWSYHLRTLEAGHLLDEPIPQIEFLSEWEKLAAEGAKELRKWIDLIYHDVGSSSAFGALLDWLAWGLAVSREFPRLDEATQEKLYRGVNLEPLLKFPADYLGSFYQDTKTNKWNNSGYYCTPMNVVTMMVMMTMGDPGRAADDDKDLRLASVCDPCVGSGRMLLAASNYSLRLYGQDIDPICCKMTMINGAWYAPWLSFPFSEAILKRPALTKLEIPTKPEHAGKRVYAIDDPQIRLF